MPQARVLVVESDRGVRQFIARMLGDRAFEVIEAETADDGISAMKPVGGQCPVDLVICNRMAVSRTTNEPLAQFLAHRPAVPIVMLADSPDVNYAAFMFRQGVVDYLVKPVQPQALMDVVRHALALRAEMQ